MHQLSPILQKPVHLTVWEKRVAETETEAAHAEPGHWVSISSSFHFISALEKKDVWLIDSHFYIIFRFWNKINLIFVWAYSSILIQMFL